MRWGYLNEIRIIISRKLMKNLHRQSSHGLIFYIFLWRILSIVGNLFFPAERQTALISTEGSIQPSAYFASPRPEM